MPIIDIDSHFYEPADWLKAVDSELFEAIPSVTLMDQMNLYLADSTNKAAIDKVREELGEEPTLEDLAALVVTPELASFVLETHEVQPKSVDQPGDREWFDGDARVRHLDEFGIDIQFINPSQGNSAPAAALLRGREDLLPRLRNAWNIFAAEMVAGHTDRLMPTTMIDITDVPWSVAEMTRMRSLGSRSVWLFDQPLDKSISHPDFEALWSAAEDLGMAIYVHGGYGGFGTLPLSYANNGASPHTFTRLNRLFCLDTLFEPIPQQVLLASFVLDGVFERHPKLAVLVNEMGYRWLPNLILGLDWATAQVDMDKFRDSDTFGTRTKSLNRPHSRQGYSLPHKPSEYINRQVRVAPLIGNLDVAPWEARQLQRTAEELDELDTGDVLVFSSDWPHPEGRANAVDLFDKYFPLGAGRREKFMGNSIAELVGL